MPSKLKRIVRKCWRGNPTTAINLRASWLFDLNKLKRDSDSGVIKGSRRQVRSLIRAPLPTDARALIPWQYLPILATNANDNMAPST